MSLKDKVIFVSGGSRGIGLAIAKKAAQDGAKLALAEKLRTHIQNFQELFILLRKKLEKLEEKLYLLFVILETKTMSEKL